MSELHPDKEDKICHMKFMMDENKIVNNEDMKRYRRGEKHEVSTACVIVYNIFRTKK